MVGGIPVPLEQLDEPSREILRFKSVYRVASFDQSSDIRRLLLTISRAIHFAATLLNLSQPNQHPLTTEFAPIPLQVDHRVSLSDLEGWYVHSARTPDRSKSNLRKRVAYIQTRSPRLGS